MKVFLILYFIFCAIADPWVDGFSASEKAHADSEITADHDIQRPTWTLVIQHNHESHDQNGCPESCPEHTCHMGHCGILVSVNYSVLNPVASEATLDYKAPVPNPYIWGIKRPPKYLA